MTLLIRILLLGSLALVIVGVREFMRMPSASDPAVRERAQTGQANANHSLAKSDDRTSPRFKARYTQKTAQLVDLNEIYSQIEEESKSAPVTRYALLAAKRKHEGLMNQLNLTAREFDKLVNAIADGEEAIQFLQAEAKNIGIVLPDDADLFKELQADVRADTADVIRGLIGADGYALMKKNESLATFDRALIRQFQPHLIVANEPLSPTQRARFTEILHKNGAFTREGLQIPPAALEEAKAIMTSRQFELVGEIARSHQRRLVEKK